MKFLNKFIMFWLRKLSKTKGMDKDILLQKIAKLESIDQMDGNLQEQMDEELIQASTNFIPFIGKVILILLLNIVFVGMLRIYGVI